VSSWTKDLKKSNQAFMSLVWPAIKTMCGGGEIKPVEMMDELLATDLDILCGIDIWQTIKGDGCRGIASRVQFGPKNWGTFTIRKERDSGAVTEYEKRKTAIYSNGRFIYPYLTCQSYIDGEKLLGGGLTTTKSIFDAIESGLTYQNRTSNSSFFVVAFKDCIGCKIF
jgi:hypothetical protein